MNALNIIKQMTNKPLPNAEQYRTTKHKEQNTIEHKRYWLNTIEHDTRKHNTAANNWTKQNTRVHNTTKYSITQQIQYNIHEDKATQLNKTQQNTKK